MPIIRRFQKKKYRENLYEEQVEVQEATLEEEEKPNTFDKYSREEKENIVEKGIQEAIKGKAGATPANFNRITARKILDNLDNNTKIY